MSRLSNGEYVFMGRADQQIKVLGHRVELGEIEAVLRGDAGVEHVVAFGWPTSGATASGIVAFVSGNIRDTEGLLTRARDCLPPYIVPKQIFVVEEMPFNANGKIDPRVLRERLETLQPTT